MTKKPNLIDKITDGIVSAGGGGQFKGACGASIGFALISVTSVVPEEFELYVQTGCLVLIGLGMAKVAYHTLK